MRCLLPFLLIAAALTFAADEAPPLADPWDALVARGGLQDVKVRYALHKELADVRKDPPRVYPDYKTGLERFPVARLGPKAVVYRAPIVGLGESRGTQFIWAPTQYSSAKPTPLIVYLHGGGRGGADAANDNASTALALYPLFFPETDCVIIVPAARNHVVNSWNVKENMLDVVDAISDACARFNIDRKRIYLTGASMGGQGVARFACVAPELFAAFSPHAGAYWNNFPVPDLSGKPFFVVHGAKDEKFRNESLEVLLDNLKKSGAAVEYLNLPNAGHALPPRDCLPKMLAFFKKHSNAFAPDLALVRKLIAETVNEAPQE